MENNAENLDNKIIPLSDIINQLIVKKWYFHLIGWSVKIFFGEFSMQFIANPFEVNYILINLIFVIILFYISGIGGAFIYLQKDKNLDHLISFTFLLMGMYISKYLFTHWSGVTNYSLLELWVHETWRFFLFSSLGLGMAFYSNMIKAMANLRAQESYWKKVVNGVERKSQELALNPHFVGNVFNSLCTDIYPHSKEVFYAMGRLSQMLKYIFYHEGPQLIKTEINHLETFLKFQQSRFKDTLNLEFNNTVDYILLSDCYIPKLMITGLVENVFKYGVVNNPEFPALIQISSHFTCGKKILSILIRNEIVDKPDVTSHGIGDHFLLEILKHDYGDNFTFEKRVNDNVFNLKIELLYD
ncbi:histidine kinase [Litoribacter ruber]|uniref:histidine kinase n=1 Tax=Litoribacter ruber TaxID=702568 RepID=UPI001BDA502C|nr:histidine kinase [Litoribacter ruber]MBT0812849.1 histidine kinase [Litoribacter ruber]